MFLSDQPCPASCVVFWQLLLFLCPSHVTLESLVHCVTYFWFQITMCTIQGQCLDMTVAPPAGCVDFTKYTMEKYKAIVKWKTAFYSFYLPVAIAMYMVSIHWLIHPWWASWMGSQVVVRRSLVWTPPGLVKFLHGDRSWNILYGHSLPFAD